MGRVEARAETRQQAVREALKSHGFGYPAWRGGPMFEADRVGLPEILDDVKQLALASGAGWEPAPLLVLLASQGGRFNKLA